MDIPNSGRDQQQQNTTPMGSLESYFGLEPFWRRNSRRVRSDSTSSTDSVILSELNEVQQQLRTNQQRSVSICEDVPGNYDQKEFKKMLKKLRDANNATTNASASSASTSPRKYEAVKKEEVAQGPNSLVSYVW